MTELDDNNGDGDDDGDGVGRDGPAASPSHTQARLSHDSSEERFLAGCRVCCVVSVGTPISTLPGGAAADSCAACISASERGRELTVRYTDMASRRPSLRLHAGSMPIHAAACVLPNSKMLRLANTDPTRRSAGAHGWPRCRLARGEACRGAGLREHRVTIQLACPSPAGMSEQACFDQNTAARPPDGQPPCISTISHQPPRTHR